jgi:BirA family biotin operon repressor/biotin-[acetyl-CoA-carboxylase] ligase
MSAQRVRLLGRLADGRLHSGAELAATLGVTRTTVWNVVGELRELGIAIESLDRRGYRLPAAVELLDAEAMRVAAQRVGSALPADLEIAFELESTNSTLFAATPFATAAPRVLFAELQTAGRGRRGRDWLAPFGSGLTFSIGWAYPDTPVDLSALTLAIGVAVVRELRASGAGGSALKWPNDVVCSSGKLGGLLTQVKQETGGAAHVVVGLGLNLRLPPELRTAVAASGGVAPIDLASCCEGSMPSRNALAARLVLQLVAAAQEFGRTGFASFLEDWMRFDSLRGVAVRVERADGKRDGIVRGIDRDGALLLETETGIDRIVSGDVRTRRLAEVS